MRVVSCVAVTALVGSGLILGAGTAVAAPAAPTFSDVPTPIATRSVAAAGTAVKGPLAGYLAPVAATPQTFAGRFIVTAVACPAQTSSVFVTIGAGSTTGGRFLGGLLQVECRNGTPRYLAGVFDGRTAVSDVLTVAVGDTIAVNGRAGTSPTATLRDVTSGRVATGTATAFTADTAQFTVQSTGTPIPTFTRYAFKQATVSGAALSGQTATRYYQVSAANKIQLTTSGVTNRAFTVKYLSQG